MKSLRLCLLLALCGGVIACTGTPAAQKDKALDDTQTLRTQYQRRVAADVLYWDAYAYPAAYPGSPCGIRIRLDPLFDDKALSDFSPDGFDTPGGPGADEELAGWDGPYWSEPLPNLETELPDPPERREALRLEHVNR